MSLHRVDLRNCYGILPCPTCGSPYRFALNTTAPSLPRAVRRTKVQVVVQCDDCGRCVQARLTRDRRGFDERSGGHVFRTGRA